MDWLKEHWFKLGGLTCALIISLSIGYYYVIALPLAQQRKVDQQELLIQTTQEQKMESKIDLDACLSSADDNYQVNFESYCISEGRGANCNSIRAVNEARVAAIEKEEKADCFKRYPQN